jgi:fatty-acyl-CoA synthase
MIKNLLKSKNFLLNPFFKQFHSSSIKLNLTHSYYSSKSEHPLNYETIGKRLDIASDKYGDRDAHVFLESGERVTFVQLRKKSEDIASGLLGLGFKRGDRLGVWAPNCLEW